MRGLRRFLHRAAALIRPGRADADLAREIDAHLQLLEDRFVDQGLTRRDARYAARRAFGGVEQTKELQRDARSFRWLTGWATDLKLGVRLLVKSRGLTVIGAFALAVAIGAGAAYLEFARDMMHPTLPVVEADRVVGIRVWDPERRAPQARALSDFAVWRGSAATIEHIGAARAFDRHLITGDGRTDPVRAVEISASAFRVVPVTPMLGRALLEADERPDADPVAVIGHDLWQARFDADPDVIGRAVRLGSSVHTIVGVMPEGFGFPVNHHLWTPLRVRAAGLTRGEGPAIAMFGRLRAGVGVEAAQTELQRLLRPDASGRGETDPRTARALRAEVRPYLDSLLSDDRDSPETIVLFFAGNLVFVMLLGICAANVATLTFARVVMREPEMALRTALGASRARISAQLFAEALVLAGLGAFAGLAVARFLGLWAKQMWIEATGRPRPFWWDDSLSPETMLYAGGLAVASALIVGVIPALKATGVRLQSRLRDAGPGGSGLSLGRLWIGVIVLQAAVTVVFLSTVASLGWSAIRGRTGADVTYAREQFLTARVALEDGAGSRRPLPHEARRALTDELIAERAIVGATWATALPGTSWERFVIEFATPDVAAHAKVATDVLWSTGARVGSSFFETMGIPLVAGRLFTEAEILGGHSVAIVDETFVRAILGGRNAIGLLVREPAAETGGTPGPWHEIVGVVRDVTRMRRKGPDDAVLYRPAGPAAAPDLQLFVRTAGPAAPIAQRLQAAALAANPDLRIADVMSLDQVAGREALPVRFFLRVFAAIAGVGMVLSTAGIYALVSFTLARRTREIGIRIALGAAPHRIITGVFSRAFVQIGLGVLTGALPGWAIVRLGAEDAGGLGAARAAGVTLAVCAFVVLVAMIACAVPLRRALRIEPTQALRADA